MTPGVWSLLIQATGSAATVLASVWVSWSLGLAAQGEFALMRSWSDAAVALITLGLPQGLMHLQYREGFAAPALQKVVWRACAFAALAMAALAVAMWGWPGTLPWPLGMALVLLASMPFWLGQRLWRALALHGLGLVPHAVITSLPAWAIFAGVLVMGWQGWAQGFEWVMLGSAVLAAWVSAVAFRAWRTQPAVLPQHTLWRISLQTLLQTLLAASMTAALLGMARWLGASLAEVGVLSLGLQVYELFAVLAGYAAPLLYDRAARLAPAHSTRPLAEWGRRIGRPLFAAGLVAALALPWAASAALPKLAGHEGAITAMALAGLLALCSRLWATTLQAQGRVAELSLQAGGRLVVGLGTLVALYRPAGILLAAPMALVVMELLTLWRLWAVRRLGEGGR